MKKIIQSLSGETVIQIKNELVELDIKVPGMGNEEASLLAREIESLVLERLVVC